MEDALIMFAIYESPSDYPDKFVVRRWILASQTPIPDQNPIAVTATLEEARASLPDGLYRRDRSPIDDPVIREIWI